MMMSKPFLISVIIPIWNTDHYLRECILSIANQKHQNLDIILVDDGSSDFSAQICDEWTKRDGRITVIHKYNNGGASARNSGIDIAAGTHMAFVDADDVLSDDMYDFLMNIILSYDCDIAECGYTTDKSTFMRDTSYDSFSVDMYSTEQALEQCISGNVIQQVLWNKIYKVNCIGDIRFIEGKFIDDEFFTYRVIGNANCVAVAEPVLYYYRPNNSSAMHQVYSVKWLQAIEAYCERYNYISKNFPALERKARLSIVSGCIYHCQMCLKYLHGEEQNNAIYYLNGVYKKFAPHYSDYCDMKLAHRMWITIARINLVLTCRIRNILDIGR